MTDTPVVFAMPGASLMRIKVLNRGRLKVTCPGCGASHTYRPSAGEVSHQPFRHALDDCPTLQQIDRALLASRQPAGTH